MCLRLQTHKVRTGSQPHIHARVHKTLSCTLKYTLWHWGVIWDISAPPSTQTPGLGNWMKVYMSAIFFFVHFVLICLWKSCCLMNYGAKHELCSIRFYSHIAKNQHVIKSSFLHVHFLSHVQWWRRAQIPGYTHTHTATNLLSACFLKIYTQVNILYCRRRLFTVSTLISVFQEGNETWNTLIVFW